MTRLRRLTEAIKFVYASTFFASGRRYLEAIGRGGAQERMAVVIQEVLGRPCGERFYPQLSGVARSWSYYPAPGARREDGVVNLALGLGLAALLLASIGLYGVMSFVVAQRTHEVGIRVALGAKPGSILALFLKQGLRLIGIGILLGLLGGAAIARLLALVLIDLSPFDPLTFGGVSLCLAVVALLATYLPARRAMQVDPMVSLRHE